MSNDAPRINDALATEVLSASVADKDHASVTMRVFGEFERDGSRITVDVVIVTTVPAKVMPA